MKPDFSGLLEDAVQLAAQTAVGMPPLQRSLPQIDDISRRMAATAGAGADIARTKASYLLAGQNFDADKLSRNLDAIDIKTTFEPLEALADTDVEGFLRHEHRLLILTAIEESNRETVVQAKQNYMAGMKAEWEATKRKLMEGLGHRTGSSLAAQELSLAAAAAVPAGATTPLRPGQPPAARYAPAPSLNARPPATLKRAADEYAAVVRVLAERRVQRRPFGVLALLKRAADRVDDPDPVRKADVGRCWDMLASMLGERGVSDGGDLAAEALTEGAYRVSLGAPEPDAATLLRLVRGARAFLERQFLELAVQKKVRENLQVARVGGTPGTLSQVRGYINILRTGRDWAPEFEQDAAVWPELFYSLRSGDLDSAISLAEGNPACAMLLPLLRAAKAGHAITETSKRDVRTEFGRMSAPGYRNLYRQAVFNAVGRLDARAWSQRLYQTQEDFMWFRLTLVDEGSAAADLAQLQDYIRELGPKHFASKSVLRYAHVLLLSLQFEAAAEYLAQQDAFVPEAAHAAAALSHYGALREAPPGTPDDGPLLSEAGPAGGRRRPQLHVGALVRAYVREHVPPKDSQLAADYLSLCLAPNDPRPFADLVLRTKDVPTLLGAVLPDGSRLGGYVEKYVGPEGARAAAAAAGREAEAAGQREDAARLYLLAKADGEAVRVCCEALRPLAAQGPSPRREALLRFVREILGSLEKAGSTAALAGSRPLTALTALLAIADFCDLVHLGRFKEALEALYRMDIVALREEKVHPLADRFNGLEDAVRECVPDVVVGAMTALFRLHQEAKPRPGSLPDAAREAVLLELRRQARALLSFVGLLRYRFPADVNAALVRLESQMA